MNKKGQIGLVGLYDASELPKWILYPLIFFICLILLVVSIVLILFIVSWFKGDANFMPIGIFGYRYYGMPFMVGSFHSNYQECYVNGVKIDCSKFNGDEHFCKDGKCEINGVCGGDYQSNLDCINNLTK